MKRVVIEIPNDDEAQAFVDALANDGYLYHDVEYSDWTCTAATVAADSEVQPTPPLDPVERARKVVRERREGQHARARAKLAEYTDRRTA